MKKAGVVLQVSVMCVLMVGGGCEPAEQGSAKADSSKIASLYGNYAAVQLAIMPLTETVCPDEGQAGARVRAYVSLLDSAGWQQRGPGVFRFELYEYIRRSAEPKGKRVIIWPDIDLTDAAENNKYWRDYLRAYEFNLDLQVQCDKSYILEATCLSPNGRRLSDKFALKYQADGR